MNKLLPSCPLCVSVPHRLQSQFWSGSPPAGGRSWARGRVTVTRLGSWCLHCWRTTSVTGAGSPWLCLSHFISSLSTHGERTHRAGWGPHPHVFWCWQSISNECFFVFKLKSDRDFIVCRWFQESARWLVLNRKSEQAVKNLRTVARINGRHAEGKKITLEVREFRPYKSHHY